MKNLKILNAVPTSAAIRTMRMGQCQKGLYPGGIGL